MIQPFFLELGRVYVLKFLVCQLPDQTNVNILSSEDSLK